MSSCLLGKWSWSCFASLQVDLGQGARPPGHYVQRKEGLFPAPWPQDSPELRSVCKLFELLGMFVAKCIQDGRRVDLPLAPAFFKLMCTAAFYGEEGGGEGGGEKPEEAGELRGEEEEEEEEEDNRRSVGQDNSPPPSIPAPGDSAGAKEAAAELLVAEEEELAKESEGKREQVVLEELPVPPASPMWFRGILGPQDLASVDPIRGRFLARLRQLASQRAEVKADGSASEEECARRLSELCLSSDDPNTAGVRLEELG